MPSQPNVSKPVVKIVLAAAGLLVGCTPPKGDPNPAQVITPQLPGKAATSSPTVPSATTAPAEVVIATVGTTRVTQSELRKPLFEAYGFNMLMLVIQRDMARDAAEQQNMKVTPEDIKWEYTWTLDRMFEQAGPDEDREKLLDQFLAQPKPKDQTTTRTELGIIIETNAYLRKLVTPTISKNVTDDMLRQQFDETYGAQVQVRHIVTDNPQDAAAVLRRLGNGEDFAAVARQVSRDPQTRRLGGELPPFTANSTRLPQNFIRVAFDLKPGQVSDPVQAGGGYHLIKLEKRIAPKAVKFEDVKQSLREDYESEIVKQGVAALRGRFAQQALAQMQIADPQLKAEFDSRLAARDQLLRDREKIREQMEKDREAGRTGVTPTTVPTTAATAVPVTPPTTTPAATTQAVPPPVVTPPVTPPVVPPAATTRPAVTPAVPVPPPATTQATEKPPVVVPPPVTPATQPATAPTPATQPTVIPTPRPQIPAKPPRPTVPATTPATQAAAVNSVGDSLSATVDPVTGLPVAASAGRVRNGVAPIGVVQNGGGWTQPGGLAAGATPSTQPVIGPASTLNQ